MTAQRTTCPDDDSLVELGLGLATGRERATAVAHVAGCASCRELVQAVRETGESLLLLAPSGPTPGDLVDRVVADIRRLEQLAPQSRRRWLAPVAAGLLALAVGMAAGTALGRQTSPGADGGTPADSAGTTPVVQATMRTPAGLDVGTVWRHPGEPASVFVSVPGWRRWDADVAVPRTYLLELTLHDGRTVRLLDVALRPEDGTWGGAIAFPADAVAAVSVVDTENRVWCSGRFDAAT